MDWNQKGERIALIGWRFVATSGLVKGRERGRGHNPLKTMHSHCAIVRRTITSPAQADATLDGLHSGHTVLDNLLSDLICPPLVKHL